MNLSEEKRDLIPTRYSLLSRLHDWDDEESWRCFFDTYWQLILRIALKAGLTEVEAEDVVQETVMCVARDIDKFRRKPELGSFKGWLRNIVRWRVADQLRKRGPKRQLVEGAELDLATMAEMLPANSDLEATWEKEWQQTLLAAATSRAKLEVKEEHFQIFDLLVFQEIPLRDVTRRLGVTPATAYLVKHRVSQVVKKHLRALEKTFF